jgi:predicted RNA-binding protein with PUA-like domain
MKFWLMKSEPKVYGIDDLVRDRRTRWEGVRNYQARNFLRDEMKVGDLALFYHSNADPPGVAGLMRIVREAYPDPTQFDPKSPYYDPDSSQDHPRWLMVDVEIVEKFSTFVPLDALKAEKALEGMLVTRKGQRLSVQPVSKPHFARVLEMAGAKTKIP